MSGAIASTASGFGQAAQHAARFAGDDRVIHDKRFGADRS